MEKYGTYRIFKNPETGETIKVPINSELEKTAQKDYSWVEVYEEVEENEKAH